MGWSSSNEESRADHYRDERKHDFEPLPKVDAPAPDLICKALVRASNAIPEIVGELHALHYYGRDMSQLRRTRMISEAREMAEQLLVSILAAEQQIIPLAPKEPV